MSGREGEGKTGEYDDHMRNVFFYVLVFWKAAYLFIKEEKKPKRTNSHFPFSPPPKREPMNEKKGIKSFESPPLISKIEGSRREKNIEALPQV